MVCLTLSPSHIHILFPSSPFTKPCMLVFTLLPPLYPPFPHHSFQVQSWTLELHTLVSGTENLLGGRSPRHYATHKSNWLPNSNFKSWTVYSRRSSVVPIAGVRSFECNEIKTGEIFLARRYSNTGTQGPKGSVIITRLCTLARSKCIYGNCSYFSYVSPTSPNLHTSWHNTKLNYVALFLHTSESAVIRLLDLLHIRVRAFQVGISIVHLQKHLTL